MSYEKIGFTDGTTPLDMENFNHMEDGIAANADALDDKADKEDLDKLSEDVDELSADLTDLDSRVKFTARAYNNTDLDDWTDVGCQPYLCSNSATNGPGFYAYILVFGYTGNDNGNRTQVAFGYNSRRMAIRYRMNGTWNSWGVFEGTDVSTSSVGDPVVMGEDDNAED